MMNISRSLRALGVLSVVLGSLSPLAQAATTQAAGASSLSISGMTWSAGAGALLAGSTMYAKQGGQLQLNIGTAAAATCITVTDATGRSLGQLSSSTGKSSWVFPSTTTYYTPGSGDGVQTLTITASQNKGGGCGGSLSVSAQTSYTLDNTGPRVVGTINPTPPSTGWDNASVSISWTATDAGVGVANGPTPSTDTVTTEGTTTKTASATDRLGNVGSGSLVVKVDKSAPSIAGSASPAPNAHGWVNSDVKASFSCTDSTSGVSSCPSATTLTNPGAGQAVTGTVTDNAGNTNSATVGHINIDKTPPGLSGAATTTPNADGWYNGDVTVHWNASDDLSGVDTSAAPADSTITGEGAGLTASASVSDKAGNQTNAKSPAVNIDRTPPTTAANAPTGWNNTDVAVHLGASDNLSGVKGTHFILDGGAQQNGTDVTISSEGIHTLQFWSDDKAGNSEGKKSAEVKIDKSPPTINHALSPALNPTGWSNQDVTVTFVCGDSTSGVASCTSPQTVTTEGKNQPVTGTAVDNAGNSVQDPATVSIDKTAPTIKGSLTQSPNANGWYNNPVAVHFSCADALSGVASCPGDATLSGEGAGQSVSGNARDTASNLASTTVGGINIDMTPPGLSGAPTNAPNANGWYNGDVTVHWSCSDALSGIDGACPSDSTVTGEGDNLSASASVSDRAGNGANKTATGIKIDGSTPSTTASVPGPTANGWYAGSVPVTLSGSDSLSGVDATYYSVDGGAPQPYTGTFDFAQPGTHAIRFWSKDKAGNEEDKTAPGHSITLQIDGTNPNVSGTPSTPANGNGWYNSPVTVGFTCSDDESGVASCPDVATVGTEGVGQSVSAEARDNAGNHGNGTVGGINIDMTPPGLSGAPTNAPNANGWYNGDVSVHWSCSDALSGIDGACPSDSTVTGEGDNLSSGTVSVNDRAGNGTSNAVNGVKIDRTLPSTAANVPAPAAAANGWYAGSVPVTLSGSDSLSGVDATYYSVDGGAPQPYTGTFNFSQGGQHTITYWSKDKAGNEEDKTAPGHSISVKVDNVNPNVTGAPTTAANADGWYNGNVTVGFTCSDADSGLATCPSQTTLSSEGPGQSVSGQARDNAGNNGNGKVGGINIDKTPPGLAVSAMTADGQPYSGAWTSQNVNVHFNCSDPVNASNGTQGSGIKTCPADVLVSTAGGGQSVTGAAYDKAGNSASATQKNINIDKGAPTCSLYSQGTNSLGQAYIKVAMSDGKSGLGSIKVTQLGNSTLSPDSSPSGTVGAYITSGFTVGQTSTLYVTATKIDQSLASQVAFQVTDRAGNVTNCDPVMTAAVRTAGQPVSQNVLSVGRADHLVHVYNGNPGVGTLTITVNGKAFTLNGLKAGQEATFDVASALVDGANTVTLTVTGQPGTRATILFGDI